MVFHWDLVREIHVDDPRKGGGYHCHLRYKKKKTRFITCMKIKKGVRFVYLQGHARGYNQSTKEPEGNRTKKLIGQLTIELLGKFSTTNLMIPGTDSELIYEK